MFPAGSGRNGVPGGTQPQCRECPRRCGARRPEHLGGTASGVCRSPVAPVVARAGLHFWEEPVISGTRGSGAVFFSGCNLHCVFCQNYEISALCRGREISVSRLRRIYRELIEQGAHNINLVTPSHFSSVIRESLEGAALPVPVIWNSNGYDSADTLRTLSGRIQIYLPDLKYSDPMLAERYSGAKDYFSVSTSAIREMFRQTGPFQLDGHGILKSGVVVRHLILPGCVENTLGVIRWLADNFRPGEVMFSLMRQYLPCGLVSERDYPELNRKVSDAEYAIVEAALFDAGIEDGFLQEADSADGGFIPSFDGTGV